MGGWSTGHGEIATWGQEPRRRLVSVVAAATALVMAAPVSGYASYSATPDKTAQAIDATADEVFLGGHFSQNIETKAKRRWIMSVNASDGVVTPWNPELDGGNMGVWAIQATNDLLLVGGEFTVSHAKSCKRFARFRLA